MEEGGERREGEGGREGRRRDDEEPTNKDFSMVKFLDVALLWFVAARVEDTGSKNSQARLL